jgi:tetratricopeptide (TPR) repeat protein
MIDLAREAGNRALALDSGIVEAVTALAYADRNQYRNASSERLFKRAFEIDSTFATAYFWYGLVLMQQHRNDEALAAIRKGRSLEPASLVINIGEAQVLYDMRRYAEAEKAARHVLQLDSTFQLGIADLAKVLIEEGKADRAVSMMMPILDVPGLRHSEKIGITAYALARAGRAPEARLLLDRVKPEPDKPQSQSGIIAAALDALGERDKAIEVLRAAVHDHDLWVGHYSGAAPYDALRRDPRVRDLFSIISAR